MSGPIFSRYRQGENRVTATLMAVLQRVNGSLVELILQRLLADDALELIRFNNQPRGDGSTPDAVIRGSFSFWIETKTAKNAIREDQLVKHLKLLSDGTVRDDRLIILTPDSSEPQAVNRLREKYATLYWANFATLVETVESLLEDRSLLPTDREVFLLQELIGFLEAEELVRADPDEVLVVPASGAALKDYLTYSAYMCQPNRRFRDVSHLAFYSKGRIDRHIPKVLATIESMFLDESGLAAVRKTASQLAYALAGNLVKSLKGNASTKSSNPKGSQKWEAKVIFLTSRDDPETICLETDVVNDKHGRGGQIVAFTQGQRYVSLKKLRTNPRTTSELEE
jgi:hypothetical protein